ncbi:DNA/RNA non-specific endonuclease [Macrococcoides canis]|nr:DNA/RNA non-specific endonuclease [Macrococcus canis]
MMRFYEDAMHDYTANIDNQLKEKIDDSICTALDNFVNEEAWAKALKAEPPKKVQIKIEPIYSGDSLRPDRFKVHYTIGDEKHFKNIVNEGS